MSFKENYVLSDTEGNSELLVCEIFGPTFQGEGIDIGSFTIFIRLAGCDLRCSWCDSMYAVDPKKYKNDWKVMKIKDIFLEIKKLYEFPCNITISGGNPALQDLSELLAVGRKLGYSFSLETQGTKYKDYFSLIDNITFSPKGDSANVLYSKEDLYRNISLCWDLLQDKEAYTKKFSIKVVVFNNGDYIFAKNLHFKFKNIDFIMQVGNTYYDQAEISQESMILSLSYSLRELMERVASDSLQKVRVLPQLHVYAWGNERGK